MSVTFADTFYWIALINPRDQWRSSVIEASRRFTSISLMTTDEVLIETLNYFAAGGSSLRQRAVENVEAILLNQNVEVISCRHETVLDAIALYKSRLDKGYSLTDCISMVVMRAFQISEILTHDNHFAQEGFKVLF